MLSDKQRKFLSWEMGAFFHFGIRTFYEGHEDWDGRPMPAEAFNPSQLDCGQWLRAAKAAGATYAILVCKHHDGFALWPSRYTAYSVAASPCKTDVVRAFADACRAEGLRVGLYYSPADADMAGRTDREHDDFFLAQATELLTGYGRIDYLWFDGCGSAGHAYDSARLLPAMRALQPGMLLFGPWDPDVRWVGNEQGFAPYDNTFGAQEADLRLREKWFYSDADEGTQKSVRELMGLYDLSVGRGANFLLNVGPDRRGLLPEADVARLAAFGAALRKRFARPLPGTFDPKERELALDPCAECDTLVLEGESGPFEVWASLARAPWERVLLCRGGAFAHKRIATFPCVRARALSVRAEGAALTDLTAYDGGCV